MLEMKFIFEAYIFKMWTHVIVLLVTEKTFLQCFSRNTEADASVFLEILEEMSHE